MGILLYGVPQSGIEDDIKNYWGFFKRGSQSGIEDNMRKYWGFNPHRGYCGKRTDNLNNIFLFLVALQPDFAAFDIKITKLTPEYCEDLR